MKRVPVIYPILLSLAVAGGVLLGVNLEKRTSLSNFPSKFYQTDKLSAMLSLIEKDYVDSVDRDELIEKAIPEVLTQLDPHTVYIPEKEMQAVNEDMQGNFTGIGVQFTIERDTIMVIDVISGGPSQKLGLLPGDRIVMINDTLVAGKAIKTEDVFSKLRGKKGTNVKVDIKRMGVSELIPFDIKRDEIPILSVDVSYLLNENTGYIKVSRFSEKTYYEFLSAIEKLSNLGAQKLIVDLRSNPGGYLEVVIRMVDEFLPAGKMIVYTEGKSRSRKEYRSSSDGIWKDKDVAVLIDEFSASASEIFAGAIQDNDRGLIIGRRSFGKGLVQEPVPFIDGSTLRLTVARYYTPSGRCIQKPYTEGNNEYSKDLSRRMDNGEFIQKESIHFNDSLKYKTSEGRIVYGGGGIMPDVFVAADTSGYNEFYGKVLSKNSIYHFAFEYSDNHRKQIVKLKTAEAIEIHLDNEKIFDLFLSYLKKSGIIPSARELKESGEIMSVQLKALIARNCIGDEGFYSIIDKKDKTILKAVELLKKDWNKQAIVQLK